MKLIKQKSSYDCGVACLAMVINKSYQETEDLLGRKVDFPHTDINLEEPYIVGVFEDEFLGVINRLGIPATVWRSHITNNKKKDWFELGFTKFPAVINLNDVTTHIDLGGIAIMGVESKNTEHQHWIVFNGQEILDPSTKKTYTYGDYLEAHAAIIIGQLRL